MEPFNDVVLRRSVQRVRKRLRVNRAPLARAQAEVKLQHLCRGIEELTYSEERLKCKGKRNIAVHKAG